MYAHAYQQYRQTQVQTAGPGQLVLMLYEGGVRFSDEAIMALEAGQIEKGHKLLVKSQDIVTELILSLNDEAGELAENLLRLYEYMQDRLIAANMTKDIGIIEEVKNMFVQLQLTWQQLLKNPSATERG